MESSSSQLTAVTISSSDNDAAHFQDMQMPFPAPPPLLISCSHFRLPPLAAHFHIPPLHSSFPSFLHPHCELIKQHCDWWILEVAQPPSVAACRLLLDCLLPRLICRAIPAAASVPRLIHVTKMISWLTIADDDYDHPDVLGADDNSSAQHARRVMAILRCSNEENGSARDEAGNLHVFTLSPTAGDPAVGCCPTQLNGHDTEGLTLEALGEVPLQYASCRKSQGKEGALRALSKLWAEMQTEMTPGVRDRFVSTMEDYCKAVKVQATFRRMYRLPDMAAYMEIRRQASFILPCFALLEHALGIQLEEEAYNSPLVEKFRTLALDYICLCNDLISCKVEIGKGDYFSMPCIAYSSSSAIEKDWSFQDAIDHVADMIQQVDAQCVSMLSVVRQSASLSLHHNCTVNTYINALCSCMSGSLAWFLETARYRDDSSSSAPSST